LARLRLAVPIEGALSNKKPLLRLFFVIFTYLLNVNIGRFVKITKKAVKTAFLFEREKGFEPSTLSLGS
jgi:hypothetical protein